MSSQGDTVGLIHEDSIPNYGGLSVAATNEGSAARDHLANEITFLSWVRSGVTVLIIGLAAVTLNSTSVGAVIGVVFIALGLVLFIIGLSRYTDLTVALQSGNFPFSRPYSAAVGALLAVIIVMCTMVILNTRSEQHADPAGKPFAYDHKPP